MNFNIWENDNIIIEKLDTIQEMENELQKYNNIF